MSVENHHLHLDLWFDICFKWVANHRHHLECWICWIFSTRDFFKQKNTTAISSSTLKCASNLWLFSVEKKPAIFGSLKSPGSWIRWNGHVCRAWRRDWLQNSEKWGVSSMGPRVLSHNKWKIFLKIQILFEHRYFFRLNFPPFSQINAVQQIPPRQIPWWFQFHVPLAGILFPSFAGAHIQQRTSTWRTCRCGLRKSCDGFSH